MKVIRPFINVLEVSPRFLGGADFVHRLQQTGLRRIEVSTKLNIDHYDYAATLSTRVKNSQNVKLLPRYIDEIIVSVTPGINHEMKEVESIKDSKDPSNKYSRKNSTVLGFTNKTQRSNCGNI